MKSSTAERLRYLMETRELRQADILNKLSPYCKRYGIDIQRNALSQYVSGKVVPKQDKLTLLGLALDVSEAWLMGYDVPMERERLHDTLSEDERALVDCFRLCNDAGQQVILGTARACSGNPSMRKQSSSETAT